jgi:CRISPR-associated protein (TIGR02584 family)
LAIQNDMNTILIAVLGTSPAILTETVWALATRCDESVVPDEVVVVTTTRGQQELEGALLVPAPAHGGRTVWESMKRQLELQGVQVKGKLRFGRTAIRLFEKGDGSAHLEDIRTAEESELVADFLMRQLRGLQGEDNRLIGSIAGGRKTMSALMYAVFSLIGRTQDRLTHVLVNEPFENPGLSPRFYFPVVPPLRHQKMDERGKVVVAVGSDEARLQLADLPFVRLRQLFDRDFSSLPGKFTELVKQYNEQRKAQVMDLRFQDADGIVVIDGNKIRLMGRSHAVFSVLAHRASEGKVPIKDRVKAVSQIAKGVAVWTKLHSDMLSKYGAKNWWKKGMDDGELTKALSEIRTKLNGAGPDALGSRLLPPNGPVGLNVQVAKVQFVLKPE